MCVEFQHMLLILGIVKTGNVLPRTRLNADLFLIYGTMTVDLTTRLVLQTLLWQRFTLRNLLHIRMWCRSTGLLIRVTLFVGIWETNFKWHTPKHINQLSRWTVLSIDSSSSINTSSRLSFLSQRSTGVHSFDLSSTISPRRRKMSRGSEPVTERGSF